MEELQSQIDDLTSRIDDIDQSFSDLSDTIDSTNQDTQQSLDDITSSIEDLQSTQGQLTFPLSQDTIDLIKSVYPSGFVRLVAGTATIVNPAISATSNILLSVAQSGGTQGFLKYTASNGQAVIDSTSATETSLITYFIIN